MVWRLRLASSKRSYPSPWARWKASPRSVPRRQAVCARCSQGIDITVDDEDKLHVAIRVDVYYGYALPDIAAKLRQAVADAVSSQVGAQVGSVDVYIDGMQFAR